MPGKFHNTRKAHPPTEDVRKLDLEKSKQGVGQVKEDVKVIQEGATGAMTNPLGK